MQATTTSSDPCLTSTGRFVIQRLLEGALPRQLLKGVVRAHECFQQQHLVGITSPVAGTVGRGANKHVLARGVAVLRQNVSEMMTVCANNTTPCGVKVPLFNLVRRCACFHCTRRRQNGSKNSATKG